ncbi:hypothetical protein [Sphingorhabdus sp. SMR4y]|uniref:hypothetical protein n=1 Tax=Sphingorhabdus sp. SMR4y TaxID=2584094 RepID=UPI000B5CD6D6|nr:hypothetical protein [Sphingorhabdus sp. SMR4y]ASK88482.1 hypothetical protein SPHFLASMR4Y_01735 [Sphingorhabdus sp. SMR4y]
MSLLARLIEAGTPAELIEEVAMMIAEKKVSEKAVEDARAKARERQARKRERDASRDVTQHNVTDCDEENPGLSLPPKEINSNPPTHTPVYKHHGREAFPKPDWAESGIWRDFLKNRKAKKLTNTETAHRRFLNDIAKLQTDEWPPGRLLEYAVGKGWGAIYEPEELKTGKQNGTGNRSESGKKSGSGDGLFDAAARQLTAGGSGRNALGSLPDYSGA